MPLQKYMFEYQINRSPKSPGCLNPENMNFFLKSSTSHSFKKSEITVLLYCRRQLKT